ncbi:amino acid adenylation domain-containing protein [Streptomyces sp. SL13]|uniref:Amino acid adenylation domain-containing protein n=1 Tax=Streptantibioticus silvisoli TaxID=2705255 RepID=A0AA90GU10_9ACTN|nr:amino acid adenylation domain-containing protein [Streptantibioticus silvisoli]MDI5967914.1 amino acid adenylation domain-containing protein [Streptantibioticus silvisoli]
MPVLAYVADTAASVPQRTAVVDGDVVWTYAQLLHRTGQFATALRAAGCRAGDIVAAAGERCADSVAVLLALESLGAVYLPVHTAWPAQRVADVLRRAGAALLLAYPAGAGGASVSAAASVTAAADVGVAVLGAPRADAPAGDGVPPVAGDRALEARYCVFTSGTTGRPKGALVEHRGMMNHLWAKVDDLSLTADDKVAFTAPLVFDISIWQMLAPLLAGGTVVVVRQADLKFPRALVRALEQHAVTVVELVPTVVGWIVRAAERRAGRSLPALRWLISTGEELRPALAARVLAAADHVRLLNAYGPTECSDDVTHHEVTAADTARERLPVGRPITGARLYLLVSDGNGAWRAAEPGEAGELFVGGVVVGLGYVNDPVNDAAAFHADGLDPHSPTGRLYRTGDLARFGDGVVHYLGRTDRQVKVSGVRMELEEIEAVLCRHPDIGGCAVLVTGPPAAPELTAFCTVGAPLETAALRAYAGRSLPEAMVPRYFVTLDAMPLTPNGKTDLHALRRLAAPDRADSAQA